jgi:hypothetical protein
MNDIEHRCDLIPGSGVAVCRAENFLHGDEWDWCLLVERLATDEDILENHFLEMPGELIWQTVVGISHCPFCGEQLNDIRVTESPRGLARYHIDSTGPETRYL